MNERVAVIGAGAWGTTLAVLLATSGRPVSLWTRSPERADELDAARTNDRYLPGIALPPSLSVGRNGAELGEPHRVAVLAVPSEHLRVTVRELGPMLHPTTPLLSVVKGIEEGSHLRMSEVVDQELPGRRLAVLSGPNLAREIAAGKPAGSVIASTDAPLAAELAALLSSDRFRVYTNPDVVGVELGGALKNVIALAAGMVDGLRFGDSAKAGIVTRGLAEITRLGVAAGAHPQTFAGLAGIGDLIATCVSPLSRNRQAGELIASGVPWTEARGQLSGVAEGVATLDGALGLAAAHGVELPIAVQVRAVVVDGTPPMQAVAELMSRAQRPELDSVDPS